MDSRAFYDEYVDRQLAVGVNERHRSILERVLRFGMKPADRVLEIGAGVGTLTGLLCKELKGGSLVAVDLSPKSIEAAKERLADFDHVELIAADITTVEIAGTFDVVVMPDVIEHIPLDLHPRLFERVSEWLAPDGFALAHYPNPFFLEWCHEHRPDLLQKIDQPVHTDVLTRNAYAAGLWLEHLETYGIWVEEAEYQVAVLRPRPEELCYTFIATEPSLFDRLKSRIRRTVT